VIISSTIYGNASIPLPPGGRNSVHGWLILPTEQPTPSNSDPFMPVAAYFSHHTPEFWTDSPHDFQIVLFGIMESMSTDGHITFPIPLPYPPETDFLRNEYTITPPNPFSLNDMISGSITQLLGVVNNGSFDTPYERYAMSIAKLSIKQLTTVVYLDNSTAIPAYPELRYYHYPRSTAKPPAFGRLHAYMAHQIHAVPDFDQVIHSTINLNTCTCTGCKTNDEIQTALGTAGSVWIFNNTVNSVKERLHSLSTFYPVMVTSTGAHITCLVDVIEEIHCVVGPAFADNC